MVDAIDSEGSSRDDYNKAIDNVDEQATGETSESLFGISLDLHAIDSMDAGMQEYMISQVEADSGLLHFDVNLKGIKFKGLMDCGASREFMDETTAETHGFVREKLDTPFNVTLADGTSLPCKEYIPSCKLRLKKFNHVCDIYILDPQIY